MRKRHCFLFLDGGMKKNQELKLLIFTLTALNPDV